MRGHAADGWRTVPRAVRVRARICVRAHTAVFDQYRAEAGSACPPVAAGHSWAVGEGAAPAIAQNFTSNRSRLNRHLASI